MDLIGELLHRRLLTEIGEEEQRLTMVRDASLALSKRFKSDLRFLVPHAVLAAVDEATDEDAEPLVEAHAELVAKWETVRNAFDGKPLSLLRAIVLSALATAAEDDATLLAAGWYSLRSALEELPAGSWAAPLSALAKSWDDSVWESVRASWSPVSVSTRVTMPSVSKFDDGRIPIDSAARSEAASFVAQGNWQSFATTLMSNYESHVGNLVSASEVAAGEALRRSNEDLRTFASELGKKLRDILAAQESAIESTRLRGELLWWQRTAFSPTLRVGYSDLEPARVPLVAAYDLHLLMPDVAPLAAEHLLSGVVAKASGSAKLSIDDLAGAAGNLLPAGSGASPNLVLDSVQSGAKTPLMPRSNELQAGRAAMLLFRDLQARRLSGTGSDE
jgi:hypothetical protein